MSTSVSGDGVGALGHDDRVELYRRLCKIPDVSAGWIYAGAGGGGGDGDDGGGELERKVAVKFSQRDLTKNEYKSFHHEFLATTKGTTTATTKGTTMGSTTTSTTSTNSAVSLERLTTFPWQIESAISVTPSPSGERLAVIRKTTSDSKDSFTLDIWCQGSLAHSLDLSAEDRHGSVFSSGAGTFGGVVWSPSEKYVAYVAEKEEKKAKSFFEKSKAKDKDADADAEAVGSQFAFREDWGECFDNKSNPTIYVVQLSSEKVQEVEGVPDNMSAGQLAWLGDDRHLVFVGVSVESGGRRLGIVYCDNRPSGLYVVRVPSFDDAAAEETPEAEAAVAVVEAQTAIAAAAAAVAVVIEAEAEAEASPAAEAAAAKAVAKATATAEAAAEGEASLAASLSAAEGASFDNTPLLLSDDMIDISISFPRVSPDGSRVVFLSRPSSTIHKNVSRLRVLEVPPRFRTINNADDKHTPMHMRELSDFHLWTAIDIPNGDGTGPNTSTPSTSSSSGATSTPSGPFTGLFATFQPSLRRQCWLNDGSTLVLSSLWRSKQVVMVVRLPPLNVDNNNDSDNNDDSNSKTHVYFDLLPLSSPNHSSLLFAARDGLILYSESSPSTPSTISIVRATTHVGGTGAGAAAAAAGGCGDGGDGGGSGGDGGGSGASCSGDSLRFTPVAPSCQYRILINDRDLAKRIGAITTQVLTINPTIGPPLPFEAILLSRSSSNKSQPLVVMPHGGPHSAFTTAYSHFVTSLVLFGYGVLLVNYRGSFGFGKEFLESLPGHCGTNDVADVMAALDHVRDSSDVTFGYDNERVVVVGGSHGGFLAGHCVGQHPDRFASCVMRNPVTNIASMVSKTDIPDWCFAEVFGMRDGERSPNPNLESLPPAERGPRSMPLTGEVVAQMFDASPMRYVGNVKTPTLMMLGKADRRVPNFNGFEFYYSLLQRQVPTKLLVYPDAHAIAKVGSEADALMHIGKWFEKYVPASSQE